MKINKILLKVCCIISTALTPDSCSIPFIIWQFSWAFFYRIFLFLWRFLFLCYEICVHLLCDLCWNMNATWYHQHWFNSFYECLTHSFEAIFFHGNTSQSDGICSSHRLKWRIISVFRIFFPSGTFHLSWVSVSSLCHSMKCLPPCDVRTQIQIQAVENQPARLIKWCFRSIVSLVKTDIRAKHIAKLNSKSPNANHNRWQSKW